MPVPRFDDADFDVFTMGEFAAQIAAMRARVTPKLAAWGAALATGLAERVGHPLYPHVAKHMRRRTNPPLETWVAFGPGERGYKKDPVLALVASREGLQARVMLKHEALALRARLPGVLKAKARDLASGLARGHALIDFYDRDHSAVLPEPFDAADTTAWGGIAALAAKKSRAFDVGLAFTRAQSCALTPAKLLGAFDALLPIYRRIGG